MIRRSIDPAQAKGWLAGPWDSRLPIPVGFATQGIAEPHVHACMYEVYLVARGESVALVNGQEVILRPGDMLVVEPGEAHTFTRSSPDYLHFVIQTPFVAGDKQTLSSEANS